MSGFFDDMLDAGMRETRAVMTETGCSYGVAYLAVTSPRVRVKCSHCAGTGDSYFGSHCGACGGSGSVEQHDVRPREGRP